MFRAIDRLRRRFAGRSVEFHYIGTSDPHRFAEFAAIEDLTIRHGFKDAAGMAATLASVHAGILTSEFEGMPRCVLETLAVGRPVVAVHLPQLEPVIHDGVSGFLVARSLPVPAIMMAEALAQRFVGTRRDIDAGKMDLRSYRRRDRELHAEQSSSSASFRLPPGHTERAWHDRRFVGILRGLREHPLAHQRVCSRKRRNRNLCARDRLRRHRLSAPR